MGYLLFVNPLSKDALFAIYFFLSGFTFTRYTGMTMKALNLFKSMRYTLSVYSGSMICASLALGECGPVSLYSFICGYTVFKKVVEISAELDKKLKPEEKARIVFDTIAGSKDAKSLPASNLKFLLTTSGVAESEIEQAMKEMAIDQQSGNSHGLSFEMFYERYPSVWKWYFDYMHSQNEM